MTYKSRRQRRRLIQTIIQTSIGLVFIFVCVAIVIVAGLLGNM